jgi:hypothetical protein
LKRSLLCLTLALLAAPAGLFAQTNQSSTATAPARSSIDQYAITSGTQHTWIQPNYTSSPFSRVAIGGGVSAMGINMQVAVIANRYMNLRGVGNFLNYTVNNISVNGFEASTKLNFATGGASVDFYPFPNHGFRVSPGAMFYNQNNVSATVSAPGGTSFSLDQYTYYSSQKNPVTGTAGIELNKSNPAFTITTGWGNMIPGRGGHFSFPFEIGAAFMGSPTVNMALTSGQVCSDPAGTQNCINVVGNAQLNSNLTAQVIKYQNDVNPYKYYPILSMGVSYSFSLRGGETKRTGTPQPPVKH